jgi:hypothetical protein
MIIEVDTKLPMILVRTLEDSDSYTMETNLSNATVVQILEDLLMRLVEDNDDSEHVSSSSYH